MNDYLFQLAMVINTSYENFHDNLLNIIIYVMSSQESDVDAMSISAIAGCIDKNVRLEFTEKEITKAMRLGLAKGLIFKTPDSKKELYSLSEKGIQRIHFENVQLFSDIIDQYMEIYQVNESYSNENVKDLIHKFLYGSIGENISVLLSVVEGKYETSNDVTEKFNNEERKIINDFLDWNNREKNDVLFRLISFSVDYSRLTVKKNSRQFNNLLNGKVFYLDANIFFRLMGINNLKRKETTQKFIAKCKEEKIKLMYTNITKQEIFDSIDFHINELKKFTASYRGQGSSLNKALEYANIEKSFYMEYYHWAKINNSFNRFGEFKSYLKTQFYHCCEGIECEDVGAFNVDDNLVDDLMTKKQHKTGHENVICDVKNIVHIKEKRRRSNGEKISWNTKYYLITADHKLIDWVDERYSPRNPIAVLPSVWYSLMLKLNGREKEGYESFIEFIKVKYIQDVDVNGFNRIINTICEKTTNGELQDRLLDEIFDGNEQNNKLGDLSEEETITLIDDTYENILDNVRQEGVLQGKEIADSDKKKLEDNGRENGKKIGRLEEKIRNFEKECVSTAKKRRKRNIILAALTVTIVYVLFFICIVKFIPIPTMKKYRWLISLIPAGLLGTILLQIFPLTYQENYENVKFERKNELEEMEERLRELQE